MNWTKLLYVLIITILYVPMVFLGANVFFPEYTGSDSWYQPKSDCYVRFQNEGKSLTSEQQAGLEACNEAQREEQRIWEEARSEYNGWKYTAITGFNLAILLFAILATVLMDVIMMGLFFGSVITAFASTVSYWEYARTPLGFIMMLVVFFVVLFYINKRAKISKDWNKK